MIWQDAIFTATAVFFVSALVPILRDPRSQIPRWTSVPTALCIAALAVAQWSLGLRFGPVCEVVASTSWAFIAWRRSPPRVVYVDSYPRYL